MFLSALRRAGFPLQRIRPALEVVQTKIGVEHALASTSAGARFVIDRTLLADLPQQLRPGHVQPLREVIERYLRRIEYDEMYARRVHLPRYEVADIAADPEMNFGRPYFTHGGTPAPRRTRDDQSRRVHRGDRGRFRPPRR